MAIESPRWVKSSYSNNGGSCVEWAPAQVPATGVVPVRDSKNPHGPVLHTTPTAFTAFIAFIAGVKNGRFEAV